MNEVYTVEIPVGLKEDKAFIVIKHAGGKLGLGQFVIGYNTPEGTKVGYINDPTLEKLKAMFG